MYIEGKQVEHFCSLVVGFESHLASGHDITGVKVGPEGVTTCGFVVDDSFQPKRLRCFGLFRPWNR